MTQHAKRRVSAGKDNDTSAARCAAATMRPGVGPWVWAAWVVLLAVLTAYQWTEPMPAWGQSRSARGADAEDATATGGWSAATVGEGAAPRARRGHAMAYDPQGKRVILFGGGSIDAFGQGAPMDDTWAWDGESWTRLPTGSGPTPRWGHAMVFDAQRNVIVLFGGVDARGKLLDDTWHFAGGQWSRQYTRPAPPPRAEHAMAFDARNQRVVMFGGRNARTSTNDTWQWDGSRWILRKTTAQPTPRHGHAMAYDSDRDRVVLFGGTDGGFPARSDLWEWDGRAWTEVRQPQPPAPSPPGCLDPAMAYDPRRQEMVLMGGLAVDPRVHGYVNEWRWDGREWSRQIAGRLWRRDSTMVYDEARRQLMLFGGLERTQLLDDVWVK